jgi:hypothetical protein
MLIGFIWLWTEKYVGSCERCNEPFGSIKGGKFLGHLSVVPASQEIFCPLKSIRDK